MNRIALLIILLAMGTVSASCESGEKKEEGLRPENIETLEYDPSERRYSWMEEQPRDDSSMERRGEEDRVERRQPEMRDPEPRDEPDMNRMEPMVPSTEYLPLESSELQDKGMISRHAYLEVMGDKAPSDNVAWLDAMAERYNATQLSISDSAITWRMPARNIERLRGFFSDREDLDVSAWKIDSYDNTAAYRTLQTRMSLVEARENTVRQSMSGSGLSTADNVMLARELEETLQDKQDYASAMRKIEKATGMVEITLAFVR